jgi:hypothetical protein
MRYFAIAAGFAFVITAMFALSPAKAEDMLKSGDKCWLNSNPNRNPEWGACQQSKRAPKAIKVSAQPPSRPRPAAEGGGGGGGGGGRY